MQLVARAAAGEFRDKQWAIMFGERCCGNGVLQELNAKAFPGGAVVGVASSSFMPHGDKGDAAFALKWALPSEHARFTYANEVATEVAGKNTASKVRVNVWFF